MAAVSFSRFLIPTPPPTPAAVRRAPSGVFLPVPLPYPLRRTFLLLPRRSSGQENGGGSAETLGEQIEEEGKEEDESEKAATAAAEIRELMAARKEDSLVAGLLGGVAEEVRGIEWPEFGKVVGTTGVVLAVIAGSSVALLTVNGLLAELSDRVFAGKGVQDFLSG
ncbi:Preprotein translocase subunit SECE1 [Apostasia shenzhenica]|uniref:Preprotein translocase subunit SECE1 n=1 Tax=Apostasia shenzhenica TaxID=1088818 RepID=A0A2I0BDD8_9ASPA|nr:Preprotein translocase subunit SECE1 [Apostasia shenzhenica]